MATSFLQPKSRRFSRTEYPDQKEICCQLRAGPRLERNRIHLDIAAEDRAAEVKRLIGLGAMFWFEEAKFTVLRDPEGNQFCVTD